MKKAVITWFYVRLSNTIKNIYRKCWQKCLKCQLLKILTNLLTGMLMTLDFTNTQNEHEIYNIPFWRNKPILVLQVEISICYSSMGCPDILLIQLPLLLFYACYNSFSTYLFLFHSKLHKIFVTIYLLLFFYADISNTMTR